MPTVRTNGIRTYYEDSGDGPPVVFLHGAMSDHRIWAERMQPLATDYRIVVYDLRGHGRTGGSERNSYSIDLYAEDLHALVEALNLDRPAVCGLSLGGMIAQAYAANYPNEISALCTFGTRTPAILSRGEWVERRGIPKLANALSPFLDPDRLWNVLDMYYERRYGEEAIGDLEAAERLQRSHAAEFPEVHEEELAKIDDVLASYPSVSLDHSSITVPSLLMYGERETESAIRHAGYMATEIPDAETRGIPNAGHNSHVDNPEFIIESLREFFATAVE